MPRKKSVTLTEVEQRFMEILWERGNATVAEVLEALPDEYRVAFNTVQTTIRILEQKGYLRHESQGRGFRYYPVVAREEASTSAVHNLLHRFFDGRPASLAINLLESEQLTPDELAHIERLVRQAKAEK
jgi:predicted transcriptional regulator